MVAHRLLAVLLLLLPTVAQARSAAELQLAIRKLNVVGAALYVAAHPDDENTAMLAWLANERLVRAGYLSVTRGDGGQNLIGNEKGELLGVIRTQELLAARRIDRAEQLFTRAIDFGYSKNAEETLEIWGREAALADVVWAIRRFQPDVIINRFPTTGEGGHGQHTASAILAEEAFRAAADPSRFPEQLRFARPWQAKRMLWNRFSWQPIDPNSPLVAGDLRVDLGAYNELLGRAYTEIAGESRSMHKSQGFGSAERRGSIINYLKPVAGEPASTDLFEGINLSWSRYAGGERLERLLREADQSFDPDQPSKVIPILLQALSELTRLGATDAWSPQNNPWIEVKRRELLDVIRGCAGLSIDVSAAQSYVVPGQEVAVNVAVVNRSDYPFILSAVASPLANPSKAPGAKLANNQPVRTEISLKVPADAPYSQPYWLRRAPTKGLYTVTEQELIGLPDNPPALPITVSLTDAQNNLLIYTVPSVYRWVDPVKGEQTRPLDIVPEMAVNLESGVYLFPDSKPRQATARVRSFVDEKGARAVVRTPSGWKAEPENAVLPVESKGDEERITFQITPPAREGTETLEAAVNLSGGKTVGVALTEIDYPHIPAQRIFSNAQAKLVRVDVRRAGARIGYIMGSGDDVPVALQQMGYEVELLSDEDLDRGGFSRYDAIVAGVRAYNTRKRLRAAHPKLLEYVKNGGTMVVQYNTANGPNDLVVANPGPYPFKISRDRVTVEGAPLRLVDPNHPLLSRPNRITASDFEGWIQERGLYFPGEWAPEYTTLVGTADPGEAEKLGSTLVARHGKGIFIYTGLAWFRQLPAGVPGAYRVFANLVSARGAN